MYTIPIKILLVEDNPADADLLGEILSEARETNWSLVHVDFFKEALSFLSQNPVDVVLLDLSLPDKQGLSMVDQIHQAAPNLPIVVLTGLNDQVIALEALRRGAQDYLVKDKIDCNLLPRAIRHAMERAQTRKKLRQSEEQLQRLNEELEHRVAEQTDELRQKNQYLRSEIQERQRLEEELRKTLFKEQEFSQLKSNIIAMISHEYRTPLTTILSSTELLENYSHQWPDEKKQRHFQRIYSTVAHMTRLVNDVLLINKAEAGKLEFSPARLDLVAFCREIAEESRLTAKTQHQISFESKCLCLKASMDEKLLRQILSNLLSNAIKYSPKGGNIELQVACEDNTVIFCVRDQGIGIPLPEQAQLFTAFHRSSNVGTISGTGLGLAIVKKCVEFHNGTITVESAMGVGSTFTVKLPLNSVISQTAGAYSNSNQ